METKIGDLGLAQAFTQIGDRVALLKGSRPLSFAQREKRGSLWETATLMAIMNGKAFQLYQCGEIPGIIAEPVQRSSIVRIILP